MGQDIDKVIDNESASMDARQSAEDANMAAAAAAGATIAQSQLIEATMQAGREDGQQAAIEAANAAHESEVAANDAVTTNVAVMGQYQRFNDTMMGRFDALEARLDEYSKRQSEPVVVPEPAGEPETPTLSEESDEGAEEAPSEEAAPRRRGLKRRGRRG
jgi:hypothetical protein